MSTYGMERRSEQDDRAGDEVERLRHEEIEIRRGGEVRELAGYERVGRSPSAQPGPYAPIEDDEDAPASGPRAPRDFAGRGPKGYRRADARIEEDICDRLTDDAYVDATDIEVKVENGEVTLTGTVDSGKAKFFAEQLCVAVRGVHDVHNQLRVGDGAIPGGRDPSEAVTPSNETRKWTHARRS